MPPNPLSHHHHHQNDNPYKRNPNPRILTFILRSIVMLLVISSFFIFLFIAALAVVHLLLSHRRHRPAAKTISLLQRLPPEFSYTTTDTSETDSGCAVCLEEYREGDACMRLVGCCHVYHSRCVDRWLVKVPNCPVCRTPVSLGRVPGVDYESKVSWG